MDFENKVRIVVLAITASLSLLGVILAAHGIVVSPLDEVGPGPH